MRIDRFDMERTQCLYEHAVEFNLSESGVLPMSLAELLPDETGRQRLSELRLKYPPAAGSDRLRAYIADFYPGATAEHVLVTNGGSEANYTALWGLLEPRDRLAFMLPNYMQGWGLARAYARRADPYRLVLDLGARRWRLDRDSLDRAVHRATKVIFVTHPNNPTGAVLNEEEMRQIVRAARRVGAWIIADEIYRGAEVAGELSPTFWGRYPRLIVTSGLSKAFGLPGLRTGWIVAPPATIRRLCHYHDYTTLTPSFLSNALAELVMEPARREQILARTRAIIRANLPQLEQWIRSQGAALDYLPPQAGAIALVRYRRPIASTTLFNRLRREHSVLITPGAHFGIGRCIRIGFGYDIDYTLRGLERVGKLLAEPAARSGRADRLRRRQPKAATAG